MSEQRPLISIVTVVYNGAATVEDTIRSVVDQTYDKIDYVIVDGNSKDGTQEIVKKYAAKLGNWVSEPDRGIYDAMNKGVLMCKGQWIYFLGADDILTDKRVIETLVGAIQEPNEILYGNVLFRKSNRVYDGAFNSFKIVTRNISHQALFYPRSVFDHFAYDTRYRIFADYHLNLILFRDQRWKFRHVPILVAIFNDEGASGRNTVDREFEKDRMNIIRQNFPAMLYYYRIIRTTLASILKKPR